MEAEENPAQKFFGLFAKAHSVVSTLHEILNQLSINTAKLQEKHADL